jgi:hypothetical protein
MHRLVYALMLGACQAGDRHSRGPAAAPAGDTPSRTTASSAVDPGPTAWHIGPRQAGPVSSSSQEADLRQRYGSGQVESLRIELGEGETAPGTVLYPADSLRRAEILWRDTLSRKTPQRLVLRGSRSLWQVGPGVSLGTSLKDLERLNERPFVLAGFGWDYSGVITDWKGGALDSALAGIKLYLDPGPEQYQSAPYSRVLGDRDYSSNLPAMQQLNPRVYQIFVDFE